METLIKRIVSSPSLRVTNISLVRSGDGLACEAKVVNGYFDSNGYFVQTDQELVKLTAMDLAAFNLKVALLPFLETIISRAKEQFAARWEVAVEDLEPDPIEGD